VISFLTGTGIAVVAALVVFVLDRLEHRDYYLRDAIERARIIEHAQTPVRRAFTGISPSDMGNNKAALWRSPSLWKLIFSKLLLGVNDTQLFTGTAVQIVSLAYSSRTPALLRREPVGELRASARHGLEFGLVRVHDLD
jgi:hypothetical protein